MPTTLIPQVLLALVLTGCAFALWRGGPAERLGAAVILLNNFIYIVGDSLFPESMRALLVLANDALAAVFLLAITLRYGSPWLGVIMLLYAVQFGLQSFYLVTERPPNMLFIIVNNVNFVGVTVCLSMGTVGAMRRQAKLVRA
jgi:hypothetical protein